MRQKYYLTRIRFHDHTIVVQNGTTEIIRIVLYYYGLTVLKENII
jgi:hypothetical protein